MKFVFTIAAFLFGSISASSYSQSTHLQNQMQSLIALADRIQTGDQSQILNQIDSRRNELQQLINSHPEYMQSYVDELRYLSTLVESVDQRDEMTSLTMLEVRRDMLVSNIESQNANLEESVDNSSNSTNQANAATPYAPNVTSCLNNQSSFKTYNVLVNESGAVIKTEIKSSEKRFHQNESAYSFVNVTYNSYKEQCIYNEVSKACKSNSTNSTNQTTCQISYVKSVCTSLQITNNSALTDQTYDNINGTYFCKNNGTNMTAEQKANDFIEKNGGSGLWIVAVVGVAACVGISLAVYCCRKNKDDVFSGKNEGGENESRSIFKTQIKSKNIHKRETKENLVPANAIHPEEEI